MSTSVIGSGPCVAPIAVSGACRQRGIGMLEFLLALFIFSIGMMGLLSAQLAGKKAGYDATQRSVATALARDILERVRANPGQIANYRVAAAGDLDPPMPPPGIDCDTTVCTPVQLAAFDLWQWESLLLGAAEQDSLGFAGGLVSPRACISSDGGEVVVAITWLGLTAATAPTASVCGGDGNDAGGDDTDSFTRRQLSMATFIQARR